jgi:hypothetical protein
MYVHENDKRDFSGISTVKLTDNQVTDIRRGEEGKSGHRIWKDPLLEDREKY